MEEGLSPATSFMKKAMMVIVGLVVVLGVAFAVFSSQQSADGECETTEVTPADIDAESSPF